MCLSFLIPLLSGIFGASTTTAIVGTVTSAVTAVATASAGEVIAVAGTGVAVAGVAGAAEAMSKNTKKNNCEANRIYKDLKENKSLAEQKFLAEKKRLANKQKEAEKDFKKIPQKSLVLLKKSISLRTNAKRRLSKYKKV